MRTSAASSIAAGDILLSASGVSLSVIPNRRNLSMRVVDFRSGANPAKSLLVGRFGRQQGLERAFTLVERDEVSTWSRLGFQREGTIPGFYKRSDAWVLGTTVEQLLPSVAEESGVRRAMTLNDDIAEKTHALARKDPRTQPDLTRPAVRVQPGREPEVRKALAAVGRSRRALTGLEPFGRDTEREYYHCTSRGGFSMMMSVERQPCFDNAFIELLASPRTEKEASLTIAGLGLLCDQLLERDVVCCFAITPADDLDLAVAFLANGFRRTGLLRAHLLRREVRVDAFLWTRKLASPHDG